VFVFYSNKLSFLMFFLMWFYIFITGIL